MKNVLIISYYWPPSGKASYHWPMNIAKHLPEFGWQPFILTVKEDKFSHKDESLLKEVEQIPILRTKAFEPFDIYRSFIGKPKDEPLVASETISSTNQSFTHKISVWIRMNLFVPDARVGWFFSAIREAKDFIIKNNIEALVSIGPPHSSHLIGKYFGRKFNLPHAPVFIDPWTDIIYYKNFKRNKLTVSADNYLEKSVLQNASSVVFINREMRANYINKYSFVENKSHVLYWGYNEEDFIKAEKEISGEKYEEEVLLHAGNIFDYQNPPNFWRTVKEEIDSGRKLKIKFIGTVSPHIKNEIIKNRLSLHTEYLGFLPYDKMIAELLKANYLMVCATEPRHVPGKLFEYLRAGKPILAFGEDNKEVKRILEEANAGMIFNYEDKADEFFQSSSKFKTDLNYVKQFDRREIAKRLGEIITS